MVQSFASRLAGALTSLATEQEMALERDGEDGAVSEHEPIGNRHAPVLGHDGHDDLASALVRDGCDDRGDLAPVLVRGGKRRDHDDLAPVLVHGQRHRGHDHWNPMTAPAPLQVPGRDDHGGHEGSERQHGDEGLGQEHRPVRDGRSAPLTLP